MITMTRLSLLLVLLFSVSLVSTLFIDFIPMFFGGYADQRWLLILICGALSVVGALYGAKSRFYAVSLVSNPVAPFALIAFLFIVSSIMTKSEQPYRWVEPGMYAFYFLSIGVVGSWLALSGDINRYIYLFASAAAVACFFYGCMTLNVYFFLLSDEHARLRDFIPWGFVNIRYWSHVATWLLPLLPVVDMRLRDDGSKKMWRLGVVLGSGIWWWIVMISSARGTMAGVAGGGVLVFFLLGKQGGYWFKILLSHVAVGLGVWVLLSVMVPLLVLGAEAGQSTLLHADSSGRMPPWSEAFRMSVERFPLGLGPQSWLTHDILTDEYGDGVKFGHPHNMYLMWAAEYGWLLIGGMFLSVFIVIRKLVRVAINIRYDDDRRSLCLFSAFTASAMGGVLHAGVSAVFMVPGSMLIGVFILGGYWGLVVSRFKGGSAEDVSSDVTGKAKTFSFFSAAVLLFFLGAFTKEVWVYQTAMEQDALEYQQGTQPRFWFHGNFPRR